MRELNDVLETMIKPALILLPRWMDSDRAKVMVLAAGYQESDYEHVAQVVRGNPQAKGPARGYWQNERGGIYCLMTNDATKEHLAKVCWARGVPVDQVLIHARLEYDHVLAACCARLFLAADPRPLPEIGDEEAAWKCYLRCWNPGKPHRDRWGMRYAESVKCVQEAAGG